MNNTQGVQDVTLPDNIKNAIELGQNRISLLSADEDRIRKLKGSLETECASLSASIAEKTDTDSKLDVSILTKQGIIKGLDKDIEIKKAEKKIAIDEAEAAKAETKALMDENVKLKAVNKAISEDNDTKVKESEVHDKTIDKQKIKIAKFTESISNLL